MKKIASFFISVNIQILNRKSDKKIKDFFFTFFFVWEKIESVVVDFLKKEKKISIFQKKSTFIQFFSPYSSDDSFSLLFEKRVASLMTRYALTLVFSSIDSSSSSSSCWFYNKQHH